jgi:hypothetical protein
MGAGGEDHRGAGPEANPVPLGGGVDRPPGEMLMECTGETGRAGANRVKAALAAGRPRVAGYRQAASYPGTR